MKKEREGGKECKVLTHLIEILKLTHATRISKNRHHCKVQQRSIKNLRSVSLHDRSEVQPFVFALFRSMRMRASIILRSCNRLIGRRDRTAIIDHS